MWAKASIFRIGPFWPPRRTRALVVDDGRALTLDEPAVIDEALALGDKLGEAANLQQQGDATIAVADDRLGRQGGARWHAIDSHGALAIVEREQRGSAGTRPVPTRARRGLIPMRRRLL
jgi:hypothetical protein